MGRSLLNEVPRQTLRDLLARHGKDLCGDPRRLEELLQERCAAHRREILILIGALQEEIPQRLEASAESLDRELVVSTLAERLTNRLGLTAMAARWAVEAWTYALDGAGSESAEHAAEHAVDETAGNRSIDAVPPAPSLVIDPEVSTLDRKVMGQASVAVLVVSPDGTEDHTTIGDAIFAAEPGSRIVVRPGTYREALVIDRQVEIAGDGPTDQIVVEGGPAPCLRMEADYAVVRGMAFRGSSSSTDPAIDLPMGRLVMEECDIASEGGPCVALHGPGTRPVLRRCRIHDGMQDGIVVFLNAQGLIEGCEIAGHARAGISIRDGGNPKVIRCRIRDSGQAGVEALARGEGTIEECEISGSRVAGVIIGPAGRPIVLGCTIRSEQGCGVWIREGGAGRIERCDVSGSANEEIRVDPDGRAILRSNRTRGGIKSSVPPSLNESLRTGAQLGAVVGTILGIARGIGSVLISCMIGEKLFQTAGGAFLGTIRALAIAVFPSIGVGTLFGMAFEALGRHVMERRRAKGPGE